MQQRLRSPEKLYAFWHLQRHATYPVYAALGVCSSQIITGRACDLQSHDMCGTRPWTTKSQGCRRRGGEGFDYFLADYQMEVLYSEVYASRLPIFSFP